MIDPYRTHKDVPFGWVLLLQQLFAKISQRRRERDLAAWQDRRLRSRDCAGPALDDLHSPAGPH